MAKAKAKESPVQVVESVSDVAEGFDDGADPYLEAINSPGPSGTGLIPMKPSEQIVDEKLTQKKFTPDSDDLALPPDKWIEKHLRLATGKDLRPRIWEDEYSPGTWRVEVRGRETMFGSEFIESVKLTDDDQKGRTIRAILGGVLQEYARV